MGKRIYKQQLIDEINEKIKICETYQEQNPDIMAAERVSLLDNDPCGDGTYYVNVLLKKPGTLHTYMNPDEIISKCKYENSFLINDEYKDDISPFNGCIIELNVNSNEFSVSKFSNYFELMDELFKKGVDNIFKFNPKNELFVSNFFKDDIIYAKTNKIKKIYYSIGNFGPQIYESILNKISDKFIEKNKDALTKKLPGGDSESNKASEIKMYSISFSGLYNCGCFESIPTNFEKRLYSLKGLQELKETTLFDERIASKKSGMLFFPKIYDFGIYLKNACEVLIKSKAFQTKYPEKKLNDKYEVQYQLFKKHLVGQELITEGSPKEKLEKLMEQFKLFKQIYNKNKDFKKSVDTNTLYKNNILAYEKSEKLINLYYYLKESYKNGQTLRSLNAIIEVSNDINEDIKNKIKEWAKDNIVGFKGSYLKINNLSGPCSNYELIEIPFFKNDLEELGLTDNKILTESFESFSNFTDEKFAIFRINYKWDNSPHDEILDDDVFNINGQQYYYKNNILSNENTESYLNNYYNDVTGEIIKLDESTDLKEVFTRGSNFNNEIPTTCFSKDKLINRLFELNVKYTCYYDPFTPSETERFFNVIIQEIGDKRIMHTETREQAETIKSNVENLYDIKDKNGENGLFLPEINDKNGNVYLSGIPAKIYLDTINYDEWDPEIKKLKSLLSSFSSLTAPYKDERKNDAEYWILGTEEPGVEFDQPKLCDKIWPLDFFGVIGFLGLDSLAANFGLKNNLKMYVYTESGKKATYKEILEQFSNFGIKTYDDLVNVPEFKKGGSLLNQFSDKDFDDFINKANEIAKISDKQKQESGYQSFYSKDVKVGIANGYYYYPTGLSITFRYSILNPVFKLDGTTPDQNILLLDVVKFYKTKEYKAKVEELVKTLYGPDQKLNSIPLNVKIFFAYPFLPTPESLLGGEGPEKPSEYEGIDKAFYIPDATSVKEFSKNIIGTKETIIKFDIYCKEPMICKYPKSKDPKCQTGENEGYCGLEECLKKERELKSPISFDLDKFLTEHENKLKEIELKKEVDEYNNNLMTILNKAGNAVVNFGDAITSKNEALDTLYEFGKAFNPIMKLLPLNCVVDAAEDGKNAICSASREAKDKTVLEDEDSAFTQTIESISILTKEAGEAYSNHFKETMSAMGDAWGQAFDSMGDAIDNLIDGASNIYNWCPRRFGDFIAESGIGNGLKDSLTAVMKTNVADILKGILGSCVTNGILDEITSSITGLTNSAKNEFKNILSTGNISALENFGKTYPQVIEKFGNGQGGLDITKIMGASSFNMDIFTNLQNELMKRMNPASMIESAVTNFMSPSNLIDFAQKGVKSMIAPSESMGSTIVNSITNKGINAIENQLGTNLNTLINTTKPQDLKQQLMNGQVTLDSIRTYHDEKLNLYEALKLC